MSDAQPTSSRSGSLLGPWTLGALLGSGGMATVYRAVHTDGTVAALKILHADVMTDEDQRRFEREFQTMADLDHPNVVRVFGAGRTANEPWMALEYVDGGDLAQTVQSWESPPNAARMVEVERILRGLCAGLSHIHAHGLVHRDLKPGNVLMTTGGVPKISDFGVVKDPTAAGTALTVVGKLVGTVAFMAPEQITNEPVDARTDLYSLGAVLYHLLTGRHPIEADSVPGYLARHLTTVPRPANHYNPDVPPRLSLLCERLLAKDPAERPLSADAALRLLDAPRAATAHPLRGRDAETAEVVRALRSGVPGVLCVHGLLGSGRTAWLDGIERTARAMDKTTTRWSHTTRDDAPPASVVLIDDVERLSLAAAHHLAGHLGSGVVTLVVCAGTRCDGPVTRLVSDTVRLCARPLQALSRPDVIGMMRDRGVAGPAAPALGRRLHDEFAGMPGPIDAQVRTLISAGWLTEQAGSLRAARPLNELRHAELPVPTAIRTHIQTQLAGLDDNAARLVRQLALLARSASHALLARTLTEPVAEHHIEQLVDRGLLVHAPADDAPRVQFAHPSAAAVVRSRMTAEQVRDTASDLASALQNRRRRADAAEIATLWARAERPADAYPYFVRAARRAARSGHFLDVVRLTEQAQQIQRAAESSLPPDTAIKLRRWVYLIAGEAHLARGQWADATPPLTNAVAAARLEDDTAALARCLTSLGRAHYRRGDFDAARPVLEEALRIVDRGDPVRATATRALADIRLRDSDIRGAESLWTDALDSARAIGSSDSESRAMRGLANVRALQNRLDAASGLLEAALDRLERGGDVRVRCGVLARVIELDLAAGRLAAATHRSERLLDLIAQHELVDRIADARALHAIVLIDSGRPKQAAAAANTALTYARTQGDTAWNVRLRVARALLAAGRPEDAASALPDADRVPSSHVDDPPGQLAAIRARLLAPTDPVAAKDLALWALARTEPLLTLRAFRIRVDASRALSAVGAIDHAREAAKRAVRLLSAAGTEGFRLDALLALNQAADDPRVAATIGTLARRIADRLPPSVADTFRSRADLVALGAFTTE